MKKKKWFGPKFRMEGHSIEFFFFRFYIWLFWYQMPCIQIGIGHNKAPSTVLLGIHPLSLHLWPFSLDWTAIVKCDACHMRWADKCIRLSVFDKTYTWYWKKCPHCKSKRVRELTNEELIGVLRMSLEN